MSAVSRTLFFYSNIPNYREYDDAADGGYCSLSGISVNSTPEKVKFLAVQIKRKSEKELKRT
jgi:hypothetical protein